MKTVVITGANRGLGLELVKKFAAEDWKVYATCRDTKKFPSLEKQDNVILLEMDITSQKSIEEFVHGLDSVDVLINNAGILDNSSADEDSAAMVGLESVTKVFQTNSIGPKVLADIMLAKFPELSVVINVSTGMGRFSYLNPYNAAHWPYSSSKTALNFLTASLAISNPKTKSIAVNPGWMSTDMGGKSAPVDPAISALNIFALVKKADGLENGKLYDLNGSILEW